MCKCTPGIKTPYCGKIGCQWPSATETTTANSMTITELITKLQNLRAPHNATVVLKNDYKPLQNVDISRDSDIVYLW